MLSSLAGCGSIGTTHLASGGRASDATPKSVSNDCVAVASDAIEQVAQRFYQEINGGQVVTAYLHKLEQSRALIEAVQSGNRPLARRVLHSLALDQLVRVRVLRGSRRWIEFGRAPALAPLSGPLTGTAGLPIGKLLVSSQSVRTYATSMAQLTGAGVLVWERRHLLLNTDPIVKPAGQPHQGAALSLDGVDYSVIALNGRGFSGAPIAIDLLLARDSIPCAKRSSQTLADAIGYVARRIYNGEHAGGKVHQILHEMERSRPFLKAVTERNAVATREAIIGFFRGHAHIVRVRVTIGSHLLEDHSCWRPSKGHCAIEAR
jgi:hypothetical protein